MKKSDWTGKKADLSTLGVKSFCKWMRDKNNRFSMELG